MARFLNYLGTIIVVLVTVVHFNSCDNFAEDPLFNQENSEEQDGGDADFLQVTVAGIQPINNIQNTFAISGQCDDGDFDDNRVEWRIRYNGNVVQTSQLAGNGIFVGRCTNGNYAMTGRTPCPRSNGALVDNLNAAFPCAGIAGAMTLEVEILGIDSEGGTFANPDQNLGVAATGLTPAF